MLSLRPEHVRRYADMVTLLRHHGGRDLVDDAGFLDAAGIVDGSTPPSSEDGAIDQGRSLAADLESRGPAWVKFGQLLATRADLLPPHVIEDLQRLHDDVEPIPFDVIRETIEAELGVRLTKVFRTFDEEPLASASLGQVHRAQLRDGREVAVKVQRPDIRERVRPDLEAFEGLAELLERHSAPARTFGVVDVVGQFKRALSRELDYRREAHNLELLRTNLRGFDGLVVPEHIADLSTSKVLVMEYVAGTKVTDVTGLRMLELDGEALVDQMFKAWLKQVLTDGFVHADPHPGNVILTDDDRLGLLDVGMVLRIRPGAREGLLRLLLAVADDEVEHAADAGLALARPGEEFDEITYRQRIAELIGAYHELSAEDLGLGTILLEVARISGECGLRPPAELALLARALLSLDQVGRALAPTYEVEEAVRRHAGQLLTESSLEQLSPSRLLRPVLDAKEFAENFPGRANRILDSMSEGNFRLEVDAFDEDRLMSTIRQLANRVTAGLVLAALIIGAAMLMRVETPATILGYPALAMVFFVVAALGGLFLVGTALLDNDRGR